MRQRCQYAHRIVIERVLANEFDLGEAREEHFERNRHRGLVPLHKFKVSPRVYVARPGLDSRIADAFRDSLLSFGPRQEKEALKRLYGTACEGFGAEAQQVVDEVQAALTKEIPRFEGR